MFQLVVCAGIVSAGMAWAIGAQDVAAMATAVGSKALSVRKAIIVGSICEFIGSLLGGSVCETITSGIAHPDSFASPAIYIKLMFAVLLGSFLWLSAATYAEIPVSTTHSLIGSLIGLSIWLGRGGALNLVTLAWLVGSWIVSPALAAAISYCSYVALARFVLQSSAPRAQAMRVLPFIYGATFAIFFVTIAHSVSAPSSHAHGGSGSRAVLMAAAAVCAATVIALRVSAPLALLASGRASFGQV